MLALSTLVAVACGGCGGDQPVLDPAESQRVPTTPDILMENFATAYQALDLEAYAALLHPDFVFSFQPCDVAKLGLSTDHYDRAEELATAARMFAREPLVKSDGRVVPAITAIVFEHWERETAWEDASAAARAGSLRATYRVRVRFARDGHGDLTVAGRAVFFAVRDAVVRADGSVGRGWQLLGWIDLTAGCGG